ncbi:MAG: ATP synthase F1 subunit epsilon [Bacilli bacterium]|nr:ATP synthase F1 subunit epsilon [Bacilli bacterium]
MKTFLLEIYTPYGKYFDRYVNELVIQTEEYVLGILPNHAPLVAKVKTGKMEIVQNGERKCYANGEGLINVKKDGVTLIVDSVERKDEIDIDRAKEAKKRAEERLREPLNIDVERATRALIRANNRIAIYEDE